MTIAIPNFKNAHILVIGDIMLDRYWSGSTSRISPEAPVPVVKIGDIEDRLGGAANVAKNIAVLGCKTSICGVLGTDTAGEKIKELLDQANIDDLTISDSRNPTITKLRVLSRHQQLLRMDFEEEPHNCTSDNVIEILEDAITKVDCVVISDYAKGTVSDPQKIIQLCNDKGVSVFVDPKGKDFIRYKNATLITPNLSEIEGVIGKSRSLSETFEKTEELRRELSLDNVLVTLSEKGMVLIQSKQPPFHMPTSAKDVFDVTGAGDTVIATVAASVASKVELQDAVRLANIAAGVVVGKLGTSTVSVNELKLAIETEDKEISKGITSLDKLCQQLHLCRQKGERIVFTNGCFDILHAGHVRYLKQAAALGDRLIVGMNSDHSISRLKGSNRPIATLAERMEVMSSITCVDWVIPFEEDTPKNLIDNIVPDVLAKGGDYEVEKIVGYHTVTGKGGIVKTLPYVEGCSTTSIVKKIKELP